MWALDWVEISTYIQERKKNLNSIKDDDKETSERKKVLVRKEESIESVSDILRGGAQCCTKTDKFWCKPPKNITRRWKSEEISKQYGKENRRMWHKKK